MTNQYWLLVPFHRCGTTWTMYSCSAARPSQKPAPRLSSVFREIAYAGPPLAYAATGVLLQAFGGSGALIVLVVLAALQAAATIGLPYIRSAPPPVVDGVL